MANNSTFEASELNSLSKTKAASVLALFTSGGGCALPATLVGLGAGAAMSSLVSNVPQLVWFSEHKVGVFGFAAIILLLSGVMQWNARSLSCPADATLATACIKTRKTSFRAYLFSVVIFLIGGFFAFIAILI